jgi:hypothetical protein
VHLCRDTLAQFRDVLRHRFFAQSVVVFKLRPSDETLVRVFGETVPSHWQWIEIYCHVGAARVTQCSFNDAMCKANSRCQFDVHTLADMKSFYWHVLETHMMAVLVVVWFDDATGTDDGREDAYLRLTVSCKYLLQDALPAGWFADTFVSTHLRDGRQQCRYRVAQLCGPARSYNAERFRARLQNDRVSENGRLGIASGTWRLVGMRENAYLCLDTHVNTMERWRQDVSAMLASLSVPLEDVMSRDMSNSFLWCLDSISWRNTSRRMTDLVIALLPLELPAYVLLWIFRTCPTRRSCVARVVSSTSFRASSTRRAV